MPNIDATPDKWVGDYYIVTVAGTQTISGLPMTLTVNDYVAYNGNAWIKKDFTIEPWEIQFANPFVFNDNGDIAQGNW